MTTLSPATQRVAEYFCEILHRRDGRQWIVVPGPVPPKPEKKLQHTGLEPIPLDAEPHRKAK